MAKINVGCTLGDSDLIPLGFQFLVRDWSEEELDEYFGGAGEYVDTGSALGVPGAWDAMYPRGFELSKVSLPGHELEFMLILKNPNL